MSRPLKLKVTGAVCCRLSNSPTSGYRAVCGGAPQTFFPFPVEEPNPESFRLQADFQRKPILETAGMESHRHHSSNMQAKHTTLNQSDPSLSETMKNIRGLYAGMQRANRESR